MNIDFTPSGNIVPKEDAKIDSVLAMLDKENVEVKTDQLDLSSIKAGLNVDFTVSDNIAPKQ